MENYPEHSHNKELEKIIQKLKNQQEYIEWLENELAHIQASKGWKLIKVIRAIVYPLRVRLVGAAFYILKRIPVIGKKIKQLDASLLWKENHEKRRKDYQKWFAKNFPDAASLKSQEAASQKFTNSPLISIILPTYNTPTQFLRRCIESVLNQTYRNWQLCVADDASTDSGVREIIKEYAAKDPRIKYIFRGRNGHICRASNSSLKIADGEYVALLDHDDLLWPNALYENVKVLNQHPRADFIYSDEDKLEEDGTTHSDPFFKPDWSPDYLRAVNYITHFALIRKKLVDQTGGFRPGYEGTQDWDLFLRISNVTDSIFHIPKVLYSWRKSPHSTASQASAKDYAYINQKKALADDAKSRGYKVAIAWTVPYLTWRLKYELKGKPLVSIIIPTKDQYRYIKKCLNSILRKSSYPNYELIIVDTGSKDPKVQKLYEAVKKQHPKTRVSHWDKPFNFAAVCNYGAEQAKGSYLLFLNNDTEVITPNWIEGMLEHAQRPEVAAVGCKLLYGDGKIQHAGVVLGIGAFKTTPGVAGHLFQGYIDSPPSDPYQNIYTKGVRNLSAVTAACLMVAKDRFDKVKGFDPKFRIAFNDVDLCLKLRSQGWCNIYTPHVELYHYESVSVGKPGSDERDMKELIKEARIMGERWNWKFLSNDPYYNPNFRRDTADARLKLK